MSVNAIAAARSAYMDALVASAMAHSVAARADRIVIQTRQELGKQVLKPVGRVDVYA